MCTHPLSPDCGQLFPRMVAMKELITKISRKQPLKGLGTINILPFMHNLETVDSNPVFD